MVTSLVERLADPDALVCIDGGMGSALQDRGIDVGNPLWGSVALLDDEGLRINESLHAEYVKAGAELLIANTHNASLGACERFLAEGFGGSGMPNNAPALLERVNHGGIESARRAAQTADVLVAGCLASPDTPYATEASLTPDEVQARLEDQYRSLLVAKPDLIIFEMLTTESDVKGVAALVAAVETKVPVAYGLVFGDWGQMLGNISFEAAWSHLAPLSPPIVFIQCTHHERVDAAVESWMTLEGAPGLGVYANDGRVWSGGAWHGNAISPEAYADKAMGWRDRGARVIGGCCGTGPAHIEALSSRLRV